MPKFRLLAAFATICLISTHASALEPQYVFGDRCDTVPAPTGPVTPPGQMPPAIDPAPAPGLAPDPLTTPAPAASAPDLSSLVGQGGSLGTGTAFAGTQPGYIDFAVPMTQFRLRFDAGYEMDSPDRAEFFYAQCGCFGGGAPGPGDTVRPSINTEVDFQSVSGYLEWATSERFSVFAELPFRFIVVESDAPGAADTGNTGGVSDMNAGFKYVLNRTEHSYFTLQLRTYIPTGEADEGLGNDHVSLEPALLYYRKVTDRLSVTAELRDWIPIGGSSLVNFGDFRGNVLRYGVGAGYTIHEGCHMTVTPITEFVAWSVLDGLKLNTTDIRPEEADTTIVNFKFGVRFLFSDLHRSVSDRSSLYVGYGRALTGEVWYADLLRVDYALQF